MYLTSYGKCCNAYFSIFRGRNKIVNLYRNYNSDGAFGYKPKVKNVYNVPKNVLQNRSKESNFYRLVTAFRQHAHKTANVNPVPLEKPESLPELDPINYGLSNHERVSFDGILNYGKSSGTVSEALEFLNGVYNSKIGAEFTHLESKEEIEWLSNKLEQSHNQTLSNETKIDIAREMIKSQAFDNFLAVKFPSVKRYGGEGAESMMAFFHEYFKLSAEGDIEEIIIAMPHRGRLNVLTGLLKFPPVTMFSKFKGNPDFSTSYECTGDVLSHCIASEDLEYNGKSVHVSMVYNPSHLEAVNPVSMGKTRSKYLSNKKGEYGSDEKFGGSYVNLQIHGDAAYTGQGINQECLEIAYVPHFDIGGTVHLIVNNQLGFTTPGERGRSSRYCSDVSKIISAPVLHVNGDDPEMMLKATRIAFEYQQKFRKDVFVDMYCYRQWGHNEVDDPTFTNPMLYKLIHSRKTIPDEYSQRLVDEGVLTKSDVQKMAEDHRAWLNEHLKSIDAYNPPDQQFKKQWEGFSQAANMVTTWDTGVKEDVLNFIGKKSVAYPETFTIHPHLLKTYVKNRLANLEKGTNIDWATAETMAIGSLLYQGYNVRFSGQDVGRGTFSHRHTMLVDQKTNNMYIPLNSVDKNQTGFLEVANSILSEEAVLGYEYGMSVDNPNNLIIWEAQFGDFFNGAQIIFDTFITSGETKWIWSSGITILLPHGYDGAGPEHSSSRIERFLQLTDSKESQPDGDNVNMQVCQPSTPAQYFHLLRRQMLRTYRKPLIIIAPKTLIRLSAATSTFAEMTEGTSFKPVISDDSINPLEVRKVILVAGKHYYSLIEKRESLGIKDTAIIRLESFCPFPTLELQQELAKYSGAKVFLWSQEEPRNMGGWTFVKPRFENLIGRRIQYVGRPTLPTPAVGVGKWHQEQANDVLTKPFLLDSRPV